jgi:hypothetical protein
MGENGGPSTDELYWGAPEKPCSSTAAPHVSVHQHVGHPHALAATSDLLAAVGDAEVEAPPALDMVPAVVVAGVQPAVATLPKEAVLIAPMFVGLEDFVSPTLVEDAVGLGIRPRKYTGALPRTRAPSTHVAGAGLALPELR